MVKLVTLAMTFLVATSAASPDSEEQRIVETPQQHQGPDLEEDRTINLVTDVVVRVVECAVMCE